MNPRVTWLLPVRNGMPYLPETLASIEAQTYQNWEMIAWVNGSTDGTLEELLRWIPERLPGRIVAGQPTSYGEAMAGMTLLAETELCAIIHADDINAPDRLAKQVQFMQAHPEVAVVGGRYDVIDALGVSVAGIGHQYLSHDDIVHYMVQNTAIGCPTALFRRSAVLDVGNHRPVTLVEDYDLWLRLAVHHKLANLDDCVLHYRIHPQSATQIAVKADLVAPAANACFYETAPVLYGLSPADAVLLRERRHPFALRPLFKVAQYLSRTQGRSAWKRFFSPSFVEGGRGLVNPRDILSRLPLTLLAYRAVPLRVLLARVGQKLFRR
jgi:glycosyltransferase involved in cell wall biosynthesis